MEAKGVRCIRMSKKKYSKDVEALVIMRIESQLPDELVYFIGNEKCFDRAEMIQHVKNGDDISSLFPGEDFLINAPMGLSFPTDIMGGVAVISILILSG